MVHNVTEGLGIAAPASGSARDALAARGARARSRARRRSSATWLGGYAANDVLAALFFGIAAGAALQVVVEVARYVARTAPGGLRSGWAIGGYLAGIAAMWVTGLLIG